MEGSCMLLLNVTRHPMCTLNVTRHPMRTLNVTRHPECTLNVTRHPMCTLNVKCHPMCTLNVTRHPMCTLNVTRHPMCILNFHGVQYFTIENSSAKATKTVLLASLVLYSKSCTYHPHHTSIYNTSIASQVLYNLWSLYLAVTALLMVLPSTLHMS